MDSSGARFLLAAETAHVMGVDMPNKQRVTTLAVREVQVCQHYLVRLHLHLHVLRTLLAVFDW